jgi:hypothetical protein
MAKLFRGRSWYSGRIGAYMRHPIWSSAIGVVLILWMYGVSSAITIDLYYQFKERTRKEERARIDAGEDRNRVRRESNALIKAEWDDYLLQHAFASVGAPTLNGELPVANVANGVSALLQFQFINSQTHALTGAAGLQAAGVVRVDYAVNLDPALEDAQGIAPYNTFIGSSTDRASLFSLMYTPSGFEDDILATPFNAAGNAIVFSGVGGSNVAGGTVVNIHSVREPSIMLLLGSSLAGLATIAWRRHRK